MDYKNLVKSSQKDFFHDFFSILKKIKMWFCSHKMWGVKVGDTHLNYTCLQCGLTKQQKRP